MKYSDEYDYEAQYAMGPPMSDVESYLSPRQLDRRQQPQSFDEASLAGPIKPRRHQSWKPPQGSDTASIAPLRPPRRTWLPPEREQQSVEREHNFCDEFSFSTMPSCFVSNNNDEESTVGAMTTDSKLLAHRIMQELGRRQDGDVEAPSSLADMDYSVYDLSIDDSPFEFRNSNNLRTSGADVPSSMTDTQIINIQQQQQHLRDGQEEGKDQQVCVSKPRRGLRLIEQVLLLVLIFIFTFFVVYIFTSGRL